MTGAAALKILIVDDDEKARARLIDKLRFPDLRVVSESAFGAAAVSWASRLDVDVVLVVVEEPVVRGLRTIELLTAGPEQRSVIAVSTRGDRELMRKAMLAGARDYLVLSSSDDDLRSAIIRVYQQDRGRRGDPAASGSSRVPGTIITVLGVKGGIGKTVTAVNLAASIAQVTRNHVALVDADVQFGDCTVMLDLVPERTIVDAASEADPANPHLIAPYLTDHASRLSLLAAPRTPSEADQVTPELVSNVLAALAATHDFVVTDTSPQLDAVTALAIDLSAIVLVLVTPEVPCVRRTRAALDLLEAAGYSRDKIKVVLNRASRRPEVPNGDLVAALGHPIFAEIPDDRAVSRSITSGVPLVTTDTRSPAGRAYLELGRKLTGASQRQSRRLLPWRRHDAGVVSTPPSPVEGDALVAAWGSALRMAAPPDLAPGSGMAERSDGEESGTRGAELPRTADLVALSDRVGARHG